MATSAGMVFEYRVHQYLREWRVLELHTILANNHPEGGNYAFNEYQPTHPVSIELQKMEQFFVGNKTKNTHEFHVYFRPQHSNFPSIDSWTIIQRKRPLVLAFQITTNKRCHDLKKEGLDRLRALAPRDALICPVIVTPMGVTPLWGFRLVSGLFGGYSPHSQAQRVFRISQLISC